MQVINYVIFVVVKSRLIMLVTLTSKLFVKGWRLVNVTDKNYLFRVFCCVYHVSVSSSCCGWYDVGPLALTRHKNGDNVMSRGPYKYNYKYKNINIYQKLCTKDYLHPRAAEYLMYLINVMFYICHAFVFVSTFFSFTFLVMHGIKIN